MKRNTINLTENAIGRIISEATMKVIKEYNGSDAIEDWERGYGDPEGNPHDFEDPAGTPETSNDMEDDSMMRRDGTVMELCNTWFPDEAAMEDFLLELGELIDMPDEMEEILARLDQVEEEEEKMTGF